MNRYFSYITQILKGHLTHRNIPIMVTLCVTPRCNLKCLYCYTENYQKRGKEFTTEEILRLIDELTVMGTKYISLNGGEALLRPDIESIVDKIKQKNILCHLSTNGLLIKERFSCVKKIDSLSISIDGIGKSNDLNRGSGVYDKIIETFEFLKKNHFPFHTHTVLTKNNKSGVEEMLFLARQYGFQAQFSTLRLEDSPDKQINLDDEELKRIIRKIIDYKKKSFPVFFSHYSYVNLLKWPFAYNKQMFLEVLPAGYHPINCYIKRFACHIEADGQVYPCIVLVNKFKAKNFLELGFKKAWEHLANNPCQACYNVCCSDLNLIFELRPGALWRAFKLVRKRI